MAVGGDQELYKSLVAEVDMISGLMAEVYGGSAVNPAPPYVVVQEISGSSGMFDSKTNEGDSFRASIHVFGELQSEVMGIVSTIKAHLTDNHFPLGSGYKIKRAKRINTYNAPTSEDGAINYHQVLDMGYEVI